MACRALLLLADCGSLDAPGSRDYRYDDGRKVTLPHVATRIVSVAPGATEMLFAAGAGERVIATVEYSDEPAAAKRVPRIGDGIAIDMERVVALRPDVVVVWPGGGNPAQIVKLASLGFPLYHQQVNTLADLPASLRRLGELAGTQPAAGRAAHDIELRLGCTCTALPPRRGRADRTSAGVESPDLHRRRQAPDQRRIASLRNAQCVRGPQRDGPGCGCGSRHRARSRI